MAGRGKGVGFAERQQLFLRQLDEEGRACYVRCVRQGMSAPEARTTALDDVKIRARYSREKQFGMDTRKGGSLRKIFA
nr:MAG TPA: hypothetical protein [Caudoviricetes sp.]